LVPQVTGLLGFETSVANCPNEETERALVGDAVGFSLAVRGHLIRHGHLPTMLSDRKHFALPGIKAASEHEALGMHELLVLDGTYPLNERWGQASGPASQVFRVRDLLGLNARRPSGARLQVAGCPYHMLADFLDYRRSDVDRGPKDLR
jgi:hypothetical protein